MEEEEEEGYQGCCIEWSSIYLASEMKLAVVGGRKVTNYDLVEKILDDFIRRNGKPEMIVSGGAKGVDSHAAIYAHTHDIELKEYPPDWSLGKYAPLKRNTTIVENSTFVVAIPDSESRGTYDTIRKAKERNIPVEIYTISG